jgi:cytochrome c553
LCAWTAASVAQPAAQRPGDPLADTIEARVLACAPCHGPNGEGSQTIRNVHFPPIAGKPAGYLYNQLVAFREGRRKYTPMNYLLAYLPDAYLRRMAEHYAGVTAVAPPVERGSASADVLKHGESLAMRGERVPACVACHGPALTGREPGIPGLVGLRAEYISAQLGAWRYGTRTAVSPDCMQVVASSLSEADVAAVAAWLASRPMPANTRPLPRSNQSLPMNCGSQRP